MLNRPGRFFVLLMISIMMVSTILSSFPFTIAKASASPITALNIPVIYDQPSQSLGKIKIEIPAGAVKENDVMIVKSPYALHNGISTVLINEDDTTPAAGTNYLFISKYNNGLQKQDITVTAFGPKEFKITAAKDASFADNVTFYIILNNVDINKGEEGPVKVQFDGPSSTGFPTGDVIAATVVTKGVIELSAEGIQTSNTNFSFHLRLKELLNQSLKHGQNSINLTLPSGFEWNQPDPDSATVFYGEEAGFSFSIYENELAIHVNSTGTKQASMWDIPLSFTAEDDNRIISGDIYAYVSGLTKTDVERVKVGIYKDYDVSIGVDNEIPTIVSGKTDQEIATVKFTELVPHSLLIGRSLTLTLPSHAKWVAADTDKDGIDLGAASVEGNGRILSYTVSGASSDAARLELDQLKVAVRPGYTGDLEVIIEGAGIEKVQIVVAKVVKPVTITAASVPDVVTGKSNQAMADILIKENVKEALKKNGSIEIILPKGVQFKAKPEVKITAGNLYLKRVSIINDNTLQIIIDANSTKPSTISISNAELTIDRTVPEGFIDADIRGTALIDTTGTANVNGISYDLWKYDYSLGEIAVADMITPAPGNTIGNKVEFVINQPTYFVNGKASSMDVAPFIEKSTTYLPIRYVAVALGVDTDNILWDDDANKVTILKGDRIVQLKIGSKIMMLNGIAIPMDVPAQIKNGRTQLPLRFVSEAFGAKVDYDEQTRTVTIQ